MSEEFGANIKLTGHRCYRCGHSWLPNDPDRKPIVCAKCKSPYWDKPKTRGVKDD